MAAQSRDRRRRIDALFSEALELPASQHDTFLEAHTDDDPELRDAVEKLLAAVAEEEDSELTPGGAWGGALGIDMLRGHRASQAVSEGTRIGPFRILDEIGRGGMAVVYRAERMAGGFEQRVAIKLLKRGADTEEILARFVQERQILAGLEHPAIARLLDGGATDDGQPYFAMELVEGLPIDRYCADVKLDLESRLRLFVEVCRAVEHAHRRLVVHRDLKPSNVLVTESGQVKLLDFGIAKLLDPGRQAAAPRTRTQLRILTPEYASPEQIVGQPVTTATDVYQLGLLLYELLTGRRPFPVEGRSPSEVEQAICHQRPTAPSTAVTRAHAPESEQTSAEPPGVEKSLPDVDRRRLARRLRGDLDNVVLKALRKEPERRYAGVGDLAADLERFLAGHTVSARPASLGYRASKFIRRNAWGLTGAAAVVLMLAGLLTFHSLRLARERDRAQQEAEKANEVASFLSTVLGAADPMGTGTGQLTSRALLDEGVRRMDEELADQPEIKATLLARVGQIYRNLGVYDEAERRLQESLALRGELFGEESLPVAESHHLLGAMLLHLNKFRRGREHMEQAVTLRRRFLGPRHPEVALSLRHMAGLERVFGNHQEAEAGYREAVSILEEAHGPEHLELATTLMGQARHYGQLEQPLQAIPILERALAIRERGLGPDSARVADVLIELGRQKRRVAEVDTAWRFLERAGQITEAVFPADHPELAVVFNEQARTLRDLDDPEAARERAERAVNIARKSLGPTSPNSLSYQENLIEVLLELDQAQEALPYSEHYLRSMEELLGADHRHLLHPLLRHAEVLLNLGDPSSARQVFERARAVAVKPPAPNEGAERRLKDLAARLAVIGEP